MKNRYLLLLATLLLLASCSKDEPEIPQAKEETVSEKKQENPYTVANMRKAYAALSEQTRASAEITINHITATHYYVKFMPETEEEEGLLKSKVGAWLELYPYPIDNNDPDASRYVDPAIPEGAPPHYYASVLVRKELPMDLKWEVLEELYIPDEYDENEQPLINTRASYSLSQDFIEALVDKALEITGNTEPETPGTRAHTWRPAGHITYYDDAASKAIGLEGVKVRARRWLTTHTGFVEAADGRYVCSGTFKRRANYSFDFERDDFNLKGDGVRVTYDGPKQYDDWNYHFAKSDNETEFAAATIFRAAYHYYYLNIGGLRRPPQNGYLNAQMNIKIFNEEGRSNIKMSRRWFDGNPIKMYIVGETTIRLYAVTIHELSHAAHWKMIVDAPGSNRNTDYNLAEDKMCESWAVGVQWYLTKMVYPTYYGEYPNSVYTNVVIDLVDTEADAPKNNGHDLADGDKVSGYSMRNIETALIGCDSWEKWQNKIKALRPSQCNHTNEDIDALFASW